MRNVKIHAHKATHPLLLHCKTCRASPSVALLWQAGRKSNQSLQPGPQHTDPKPTRGGLQMAKFTPAQSTMPGGIKTSAEAVTAAVLLNVKTTVDFQPKRVFIF